MLSITPISNEVAAALAASNLKISSIAGAKVAAVTLTTSAATIAAATSTPLIVLGAAAAITGATIIKLYANKREERPKNRKTHYSSSGAVQPQPIR